MKAGDTITIEGKVIRIDGDRVDLQAPSGQLIQTDVSNVRESLNTPLVIAGGKFENDARAAGIPIAGKRPDKKAANGRS